MNIYVKKNKRIIGRKMKVVYLQNVLCLLFFRLDYKIWYQIKVETLPFNKNYYICELSNLNIHEY